MLGTPNHVQVDSEELVEGHEDEDQMHLAPRFIILCFAQGLSLRCITLYVYNFYLRFLGLHFSDT